MTGRLRLAMLALLLVIAGCVELRVVPMPRVAVTYVASATGDDSTGAVCSEGTPCSIRRGLIKMSCTNNDVLELLGTVASPGFYRGAGGMLDLATYVPGKGGSDFTTARCLVRARNDGGVFIDGQFARNVFTLSGNAYWIFQGFDVGNAATSTFSSYNPSAASHHIRVQRVCISNTLVPFPIDHTVNTHTIDFSTINDTLFEDVCAFGTGRTTITDYGQDRTFNSNNVFRRVWFRWEGSVPTTGSPGYCPGTPVIQFGYYTKGPTTWENVITVHNPEQMNLATWGETSGCGIGVPYVPGIAPARNVDVAAYPNGAYNFRGLISYGYEGFTSVHQNHIHAHGSGDSFAQSSAGPSTWRDYFVDARSQGNGDSFSIYCDTAAYALCAGSFADRITNLRLSNNWPAEFAAVGSSTPTNANDCIASASATGPTIGGCPNFYTGVGSGSLVGARNCFEYTNTVLGTNAATQGLWPWRMDDRIKAALARARAQTAQPATAGPGASPLAGTAGSGYAAGTVTSEIVARYGAIPAGCLRAVGPTPNPPAGLTLTQLWPAIWTPLAGAK